MAGYVWLLDEIEEAERQRDRAIRWRDFETARVLDDAINNARASYGRPFEMQGEQHVMQSRAIRRSGQPTCAAHRRMRAIDPDLIMASGPLRIAMSFSGTELSPARFKDFWRD